ncbi:MAG: hypothetical protein A3G81_16920 [Betaproteobacteria bacterium RIFCSPLOWO2_12_FULL_65_14]|nr:MAG: hypothetical protein A3G81_16920 [Betaproteobacteria bacterium RIFCSPLOWO2_12_FULL_65_14]
MHYRFRGNNIQVVKSQPDPATGKAKSVPLGSINRATLMISDKLRENCSPGELKEIEGWVKRYRKVYELKRRHAALTLPEQIESAIDWFEEASPEEARQVAEDVLEASLALRRALNRRGLL